MDLDNKRKHYVKREKDTGINKLYAFYQMKLKLMKKNSYTDFILKKNLGNYLVPDEQSNNVLIPEDNINIVEESKVNGKENNVNSEQEITK